MSIHHEDLGTGLDWRIMAACRGMNPDLFYPEAYNNGRAAKAVCGECPVRVECLAESLANGEKHGIWGGSSEKERRRMGRTPRKQLRVVDRPERAPFGVASRAVYKAERRQAMG